jgi:hypothetical protein
MPVRADWGSWIGLAFLAWVIGSVAYSFASDRLEAFWRGRARCPHGVRGGRIRLLCNSCKNEARAAELERQRIDEEEQARQDLNARADAIVQQELERLVRQHVPSLEELRRLTPQRFEDEMARMFERLGYTVKQTSYTNDGGRDAIMHKGGEKFLLECKKYGERGVSGRPDLQKFHSAVMSEPAKLGYFVTTGTFSESAIKFATGVPLELIGSDKLIRLMFESKADPSTDDAYDSMCRMCGQIVRHSLRAPEPQKCSSGHVVQPTISEDQLLGTSLSGVPPTCAKCGTPMRLIKGKTGNFWGCSQYPKCHSSRPLKGARRRSPRWRPRY